MIKYSRCKENNYHTDCNLPDKKTKKCIEENCSK